jgi:hypothetical protein
MCTAAAPAIRFRASWLWAQPAPPCCAKALLLLAGAGHGGTRPPQSTPECCRSVGRPQPLAHACPLPCYAEGGRVVVRGAAVHDGYREVPLPAARGRAAAARAAAEPHAAGVGRSCLRFACGRVSGTRHPLPGGPPASLMCQPRFSDAAREPRRQFSS